MDSDFIEVIESCIRDFKEGRTSYLLLPSKPEGSIERYIREEHPGILPLISDMAVEEKYLGLLRVLSARILGKHLGTIKTCKEVIETWNAYFCDKITYVGETRFNIYLSGRVKDKEGFLEVYKYFKPIDGTGVEFVDLER